MDVIQKDAGTHFDPELVPIFVKTLPEALKIKDKYADDPHFDLDKSSGI